MTIFLCGDVMTGRGIDQILGQPSGPEIHEPYTSSALEYVDLAEQLNGAIPRRVGPEYIWGDALAEIGKRAPDRRIANLETAVTRSDEFEPKGINYRMHPGNVACLTAAGLDCCVLANNHVLDWRAAGLSETIATLGKAGIAVAGAGEDAEEAERPAVLPLPGGGRLLVFGVGSPTSGVPLSWAATESRPGISLLPDLTPSTAEEVLGRVRAWRRPGDVVVVSVHWGENWGYSVPHEQREFARRLVGSGTVDVLHGHSSHHPKGIECLGGRPILYGCGDFVNDYEGIAGYEEYRADLVLGYFVTLDGGAGGLQRLVMAPFRSVRFRLQRASHEDAEWLRRTLDREGSALGTHVSLSPEGTLELDVEPRPVT